MFQQDILYIIGRWCVWFQSRCTRLPLPCSLYNLIRNFRPGRHCRWSISNCLETSGRPPSIDLSVPRSQTWIVLFIQVTLASRQSTVSVCWFATADRRSMATFDWIWPKRKNEKVIECVDCNRIHRNCWDGRRRRSDRRLVKQARTRRHFDVGLCCCFYFISEKAEIISASFLLAAVLHTHTVTNSNRKNERKKKRENGFLLENQAKGQERGSVGSSLDQRQHHNIWRRARAHSSFPIVS